MELRDAIYGRRATRSFLKTAITRTTIMSLIDAAIQAPSAMNDQPWHFVAIRNAALLGDIAAAAKAYALKMSAENHHAARLHEVLMLDDYQIFYDAPALVVISARANIWATEDAALAAQNLMLAAYDAGLGSCWIGFAQGWLGTQEGRSAIGLPDEYVPIAPIVVGYPSAPVPSVPRRPARVIWLD